MPGSTGPQGVPGATPQIGQNGNWFIDGADTGRPSAGQSAAPVRIESANLSVPGSELTTRVGNLDYTARYNAADSVSIQLRAVSENVLADVNKFAQYTPTGMNSASWDNTTFTTAPTTIDAVVYSRSNERHVTRIRQQDPATGLWSIHDVTLYSSANGARTNVWVAPIATDLAF